MEGKIKSKGNIMTNQSWLQVMMVFEGGRGGREGGGGLVDGDGRGEEEEDREWEEKKKEDEKEEEKVEVEEEEKEDEDVE